MTIPDVFSFFVSRIFDIWNWLDSISLMGQFSMLDFILGILFIGGFLPVVLNLRNSQAAADSFINVSNRRRSKDD